MLQEQILDVCQCLNRCEIENMLNQNRIVKNILRSTSLGDFGWLLVDHLLCICCLFLLVFFFYMW